MSDYREGFVTGAVVVAFVVGVGILAAVVHYRAPPASEPQAPPAWVARVEALEARADEQAKARCFSVKTERLDVAIFANENLGKHKVKP